ncbi:site-specific tyrosine recombinase XerD [Alpinimonas psychrophila]|uniref:Tyrosine recombinase XerC n=1 Tax=Alpinimonas psychrophila TaxID=748908 RepID=A0A7W3PNB8_9MICO|nr:site-specific tyrosine recombinase XerD [Alpinimonas psychrophila]MBA8828287.1 integrase/recombinase XerD [Alpinimonas psychrophila]
MTFERARSNYLRYVSIERGLSANTVAAYTRDLSAYAEWMLARGITDVGAVTLPHVSAYLQSLVTRAEKPLTASSQSRMLSSIRGFHKFLVEESVLETDVTVDLAPPKLPKRLPKAITIDQMAALLAAVEGEEDVQMRDRALLELLYATGARITEAVSLNVDDVLGDDGLIRLRGKGGKQRIVPVGSYARAALDAYLVRVRPVYSANGLATPALFLGPRGARVSRQMAWLIIREAGERAKLNIELSPHTFRHSFATHLLAGGADVRVVQELLGHASVATTQIYTLVTADTLRESYITAHPRAR